MARISAADVNGWLEGSKLTATDPLVAGMESLATSRVLGRLAGQYDISGWTDEETTPDVVRQLIAMLYAAALYRKAYSEDLDDGVGLNWAQWLEQSVEGYLVMILEGVLDLEELGEAVLTSPFPSFYPNDQACPPKFTMDASF
jgi:hypothetical protein